MLFKMHDLFLLIQKNQINRKQHTNRMDATGRHDPKPGTQSRPALRFAKQPDQPPQITIGNHRFCSDEGLPRFVVYVHRALLVEIDHRPLKLSKRFVFPSVLLDGFSAPPPDNNEQNHRSENTSYDTNRRNVHFDRSFLSNPTRTSTKELPYQSNYRRAQNHH